MKSYNTFAKFYDELTDNVEYEKRSKYIYDFFKYVFPYKHILRSFDDAITGTAKTHRC